MLKKKLSQRRLTANRLAPRESEWSRMHTKVSSDWLPSYIKATRPVLEMLKMTGYFSECSRMYIVLQVKYPIFLSDFNETRIFSIDFRLILKCRFSRTPFQRVPSRSLRTDGHDEANSRFSPFCEHTK